MQKLTDLVKYVKPTASIMFKKIESDLQKISEGEKKLSGSFGGKAESYSLRNQETLNYNARMGTLSNLIKESASALEKAEQKLAELNEKIKLVTAQSENSKLNELKVGVVRLRKQLVQMQQKKEILSWQLRQNILRLKNKGKDDFLEITYLEEGL